MSLDPDYFIEVERIFGKSSRSATLLHRSYFPTLRPTEKCGSAVLFDQTNSLLSDQNHNDIRPALRFRYRLTNNLLNQKIESHRRNAYNKTLWQIGELHQNFNRKESA